MTSYIHWSTSTGPIKPVDQSFYLTLDKYSINCKVNIDKKSTNDKIDSEADEMKA